jgi:hypothetical protein
LPSIRIVNLHLCLHARNGGLSFLQGRPPEPLGDGALPARNLPVPFPLASPPLRPLGFLREGKPLVFPAFPKDGQGAAVPRPPGLTHGHRPRASRRAALPRPAKHRPPGLPIKGGRRGPGCFAWLGWPG